MKRFRLQSILLLSTGLLLVLPQFAFAGFNEFLQDAVFNIVMGILGMFVWLSALLLNFAVNNFIIGFGNTFATTGIGVAVDNTWVIVRDFVNLGFIFGFVYIGFKMILSSSDSNTRRWLVNIILAALLVNFSLFVVKFAIDVSNQLAAQIAINGLGTTCIESASDDCLTEGGLRQIDIASEFMARLGLSKVFSLTYETVNGAGWGYIFGSALLSLTAMFVFAAGGILIIIRFAVLCLFMVLSPIMFLSWILPPVKDTFERFWSMFMGRAFFAPIYLLFIYFSLQIISGLQVSVGGSTGGFGNPDWAGTFQGAGKLDAQGNAVLTLGTFPFFVLAMIFMGASLVIANKLGADFGDKAVGLGKSLGNKVRGTIVDNTAGRGLRGVGWAANKLESRYKKIDAGVEKMNPWARRGIRAGLAVSTLGLATNRNVSGALKGAQKLSIDGSDTYEARKKEDKEVKIGRNQKIAELGREERMEEFNGQIDSGTKTAQELSDAFRELGSIVRQMSNEERADLGYDTLMSGRVAMHLTDSHIEALEKSGDFSHQQTQNIKKARNQSYVAIAQGDPESKILPANTAPQEKYKFLQQQREAAISRSVKDAGNMEVEVFTDLQMAPHLTPNVLEERMRNGGIRDEQLDTIRGNVTRSINADLMSPDQNVVSRAVRKAEMWNSWSKGNSSFGARAGIRINVPQNQNANQGVQQGNQAGMNQNQNTPNNQQQNPVPPGSSIIMPGMPGWNAANQNLPPEPGPRPNR